MVKRFLLATDAEGDAAHIPHQLFAEGQEVFVPFHRKGGSGQIADAGDGIGEGLQGMQGKSADLGAFSRVEDGGGVQAAEVDENRPLGQPTFPAQTGGRFGDGIVGDRQQHDVALGGAGKVGGRRVPAADETGGGQGASGIAADDGTDRMAGLGEQGGHRLSQAAGADQDDTLFHCTGVSRQPIFSISASMRSPLFTAPTPEGVPVRITSPSSRVKISDTA